jgi:hypothetical protein
MRPTLGTFVTALLAGTFATAAWAQGLGRVHFETSCTSQAQEKFDRGLAMVHSFGRAILPKACRDDQGRRCRSYGDQRGQGRFDAAVNCERENESTAVSRTCPAASLTAQRS